MMDRFKQWVIAHRESPYAQGWLFFIACIESIIFPIPTDLFLITLLALEEGKRWVRMATISTVGSVAGGLIGYAIGFFVFEAIGGRIIEAYNLQEAFAALGESFREHAFWAVFLSGFTPIPYKVFTLSAGFFSINLAIFFFASLISRGLRFFIVAYVMKLFGKYIGYLVFQYFNIATAVFAVLVILALVFGNSFF